MSWFEQSRILELSGAALPTWRDQNLFTVSRVSGTEKIGKLYSYTVEVATLDAPGLYVSEAQKLVDVDRLVGKEVTIRIAIEGNGTYVAGLVGAAGATNIGAGVREITGLIVLAQCVGADDRRAFYRLQVRPWLWLATLNRDSRLFLNRSVVEISEEILKKFPYPYELRLNGPGSGRQYPKRDYQRMFWESDFAYLNRLWQEWGISFYYRESTLLLCDSPGGFRKHGPAYERIRYLAADGQRIDEEHIHRFEVARTLTTGKVSVTDYDYTQSLLKLRGKDSDYSERSFDNSEEYAWGDYAQPLAGPMGTADHPNEWKFEGEYLAQVRLEAHRCKSLRAKGRGNLRGLMAGSTFFLDDYPLAPGNDRYLVVSTRLDIRNNDTVTQSGGAEAPYHCETQFTVQPADWPFRSQQKAKKPRSHGEIAVVTGYDDSTVWTDVYGRVKISFVWDRDRPADQNSSCWVRVSSPWQGMSYGAIYIPRVGHEVVIGYHDNDPDRPYIAGRHVNQFNAPPWELPANQALSGWLSQDLSGKSIAANSVVTDDTPGKLQVQVTSDQAQSRLVLGSNTRIDGHKGRQEARGEGIEIATDANAVMRAPGILITTEARDGATAPMKDMGETVQRLTAARELQESLLQQAQYQDAQQAGTDQAEIADALKAQNNAIRGSVKTSSNEFPELSEPQLVLASAASTALTAEQSTHIASNEHLALTTGQSVGIAAGKSFLASIRERFSVFVQRMGITMIAAAGKISLQAKTDGMSLLAQKLIEIISEQSAINLKTPKEITLNAGGTQLTLNASGAFIHTNGQCLIHCADFDTPGPEDKPLDIPTKPHDEQFTLVNKATSKPMANVRYKIVKETGEAIEGVTDAEGKTMRVITNGAEQLMVHLIH